MVTPQEAEELAHATVELYLNKCQPQNMDDAFKVLIKLFSMAGIALVANGGKERALNVASDTIQNMSRPDIRVHAEAVKQH